LILNKKRSAEPNQSQVRCHPLGAQKVSTTLSMAVMGQAYLSGPPLTSMTMVNNRGDGS